MSSTTQNPFTLTGRHVVVTGGSRGLGRAIADAVSRAGGRVTLIARNEAEVTSAAQAINDSGGTAVPFVADVADLGSIERIVDAIGATAPIDGVVHAAGVQLRKPAVEVTADEFLRVQAVNLHAPYLLSTAVTRRQLADSRRGSHVFIGSLNSSIGLPNISPYVVSKTAMVGMARAFSTEWSAHGIRANVVGPGYFATEMTQGLLANPTDRDRIMARIPMRELGAPEDVGNACVYLLSDASRYVTGTLLNVDGGWLAS
jgi:2-deoxy-D-gluconate 3-dehydrogenase